jgi:amino-acid N-acetyltransferase
MTTMNDTVQVRAATEADLPAVEQLLTASKLPLDGVREAFDSFVVAEADHRIVGVAGLECCALHALLRSVAVDEAWRSRGLGRALVARVVSDAEARGIPALYLLTTTAEQYFPSFGFAAVTRDAVPADIRATQEFSGACPSSATVMVRPMANG